MKERERGGKERREMRKDYRLIKGIEGEIQTQRTRGGMEGGRGLYVREGAY